MEFLSIIWNEGLLKPMTNGLTLLYLGLFHNMGLTIIVFTILIRLLTLPLTLKQVRSTKAMSLVQPKLQELQKRYANDKQRLSQETFRVYRENGVNPIGCLGPMVVQMPIWIGLYWSLIKALPSNPESLAGLSKMLYSGIGAAHSAIPLQSSFLWLDLAYPDTTPILPILVGGSMWAQQKMMTFQTADARQQQTNQIMLWMMPLMFGFLTFQFPSGLALYWIVSNVVGITIQYFVTGWGGLIRRKQIEPVDDAAQVSDTEPHQEKEPDDDGQSGNERKDNRRGNRTGPTGTRRRPGGGRGRGSRHR